MTVTRRAPGVTAPAAPRAAGGGDPARWELPGLLTAAAVSLVGDQLARVALAVLVLQRTASPALSAAAYASTYLPLVVAGPLLGGLADRLPRRRVLITADLLRAGLFALMAVPGLPLTAVLLLVLTATTLDAPFTAARSALMRDVSGDDDGYRRGTGLDEALDSSGQILGFAAAGLVLLVLSPSTALLLNAATFAASALLLRLALRHRPAASPTLGKHHAWWPRQRAHVAIALRDARTGWHAALSPASRRPLLLTWAGLSCAVAPEALAAAWAADLGAGTVGAGLLFAAAPAGNVVGLLLARRLPAPAAQRALLPLTLLSLLPLTLCLLDPPLSVAVLLVALSGTGTCFSLLARVEFVRALPPQHRGRAFAVAAAGVTVTQGLGMAGAALAATRLSPAAAVASAATTGLLLVLLAEHRCRPRTPDRGIADARCTDPPDLPALTPASCC